jgi:hypothetical protein
MVSIAVKESQIFEPSDTARRKPDGGPEALWEDA